MKKLTAAEVRRYEGQLQKLPQGAVVRKVIAGKPRYYRQWHEDGKTRSEYLSAENVEEVRAKIAKRREIAKLIRPYVIRTVSKKADGAVKTGRELADWADLVSGWDFREVFPKVLKFLRGSAESRVLIVYGIRRTGKTTMLQQAVRSLTREEFASAAYIKVRTGDTLATMDARLSRLHAKGVKYVFVDEVTLMEEFIDGASLFSDVYATMGMKIVLSGTDSLGFWMSINQELFDRAYLLHTTFVPFREYSRLLGIDDIDEYIDYGGLLRRGEKDLDDPSVREPDASFRDDESARRYIDTAIARNIQHSLACCEGGRYFGTLRALYEKDELTSAVNRVIEDMNHEFLASVLTRPFRSSDLGIVARQLLTDWDPLRRRRLDRMLDRGAVTAELMRSLDIRNAERQTVRQSDEDADSIKAYLKRLDLVRDCPVRQLRDGKVVETVRPPVYAAGHALLPGGGACSRDCPGFVLCQASVCRARIRVRTCPGRCSRTDAGGHRPVGNAGGDSSSPGHLFGPGGLQAPVRVGRVRHGCPGPRDGHVCGLRSQAFVRSRGRAGAASS